MMKKIMGAAESAAVLILIVLSVIVLLQVVLRNFFGTGFVWGEEASRFLLLSMVLIGAPVVFNRNEHVAFDLFRRRYSDTGKLLHRILVSTLVVAFYTVFAVSHFRLMKTSGDVRSPSLSIPNNVFFSAGIIGAFLGIFAGVAKIFTAVKELRK